MVLAELHEELRRMLGNPLQNEQNNRDLDSALDRALSYLAGVLKFDVRTDEQINLTADQREYLLPQSLVWIYWVEWNDQLLTPTSTFRYNSQGGDGSGVSWHAVASGTPAEYAIEGRKLILLPPADSTAISTSGFLAWRWLGAGDAALSASGTPKLSRLDQELLLFEAAVRWLSQRPSEENNERLANYERQAARLLPIVREQWQAPDVTYHPVFAPVTARRRITGYR